MPRQTDRSVGQDLHALIASQGLEVTEVQLESAIFREDDLEELVAIRRVIFAVRSKTHDLALVAVFRIADEFANHGVDTAERMGQEHAVEHFDLVALASRHHGGDEVAGAVITEARSFFPRGAVVSTGNMRNVVFEMMLVKSQLVGPYTQRFRQK